MIANAVRSFVLHGRGAGLDLEKITLIMTSVGTEQQAVEISEELIARRLATSVNIVPCLRSIYRWKGKVWNDEELLLVIKTREDRLEKLHEALKALHSYELPEMLALRVYEGAEPVLDWIRQVAAPGQPEDPPDDTDG